MLIGIAMPTKSLERWNKDGAILEELLQEAGYKTPLQYEVNKVDQQITRLQNIINQDPAVIVVASIDRWQGARLTQRQRASRSSPTTA